MNAMELERISRRNKALAEIELAINQPHELNGVMGRAVRIVTDLLPADAASIILWDEAAMKFVVSASTVPGQPASAASRRVRQSHGATRWIVDNRKPFIVSDIRLDPFTANPMLPEFGLQAYAGFPLLVDGEVSGVLYALDRSVRDYGDEELEFLASIAYRVAAAVSKVKLYESLRQANQLLEQRVRERTAALEDANLKLQEEINGHKRTEQKLAASEARFRRLIENASDLITVVDEHGIIRFQGPSSERILGFPPEEMMGHEAFEWVHPDDLPKAKEAIRRTVEQPGQPVSIEYRVRHRNGHWRVLESIGRNMPDPSGAVFIIVNSRDVTEQRELQDQLRQAQKMEAIGQLAGGVAHDFNNILTVIMMQVELMAFDDDLSAETKEGLNEVRAAAERAAALTRQMLLFSRRTAMQPSRININETIASLSKMLQRIIGEDIRLELSLNPKPLLAHADPGMLDQVLMNLAVNARDAMLRGGRLTIATSPRVVDDAYAQRHTDATPGRYVVFSVTDTGSGIPADVLPHIFEPFYTTKEPGKGTGLGLATVFGIIKQHRGWVEVHSEPDRGTRFEVILPASAVDAIAESDGGGSAERRGGTETILLVEDDPGVRMLTRVTLERQGYRVLEASSGPEGATLWQMHGHQIALLLTDLVMPGGITGLQLARSLKAERPGLGVIYISGYSAEIAGRELELLANERFLSKPCPSDRLLASVRECLDG